MALTDKTTTTIAALTTLTKLELWPQADGSVVFVAMGTTKDGLGNTVTLVPAQMQRTGVPVIDNLVARALTELRKANGLEV